MPRPDPHELIGEIRVHLRCAYREAKPGSPSPIMTGAYVTLFLGAVAKLSQQIGRGFRENHSEVPWTRFDAFEKLGYRLSASELESVRLELLENAPAWLRVLDRLVEAD